MSIERMSPRVLGTGLLAFALLSAGCVSESGPDGPKSQKVASNLVRGGDEGVCTPDRAGGSVTITEQNEYATLDPAGGSFNFNPAQQIYSSLMRWNPAVSRHDPLLAESLTGNDDHTVWTLKLRESAVFGDGTPLDAEAVIASVERHRAKDSLSTWAARARSISAMKAVDEHTVEFTLASPWAEFPYLLGTGVGMITNPKVDPARLASKPPAAAGAGAFVFDHWTPGNELVVKKKAQWWNGPVCLDSIRVIAQVDSKARKDTFTKGEAQVFVGTADLEISQQVIDEGAHHAKYPLRLGLTPNFGIGADAKTTIGADRTVRRALQLALDPKLMSDRITGGVAEPTTTLVSSDSPLNQGLQGVAHDPEEAKRLVAQAKAAGWDGKLSVMALNQPNNIAIGNQAIAQWKTVGIEAELHTLELADFVKASILGGGGFDVMVSGGGNQPLPECTSCDLDQYATKGAGNRVGYSNPKMDALAEKLNAAQPEQRPALLKEVQAVWNEDIPRILYGQQYYLAAWSPKLQGAKPSRLLTIDLSQAWLTR
ncbi:peptide/nickel transport system substrate-binding protein [Thermomonospora echinospora]|uniref:Peptide/nickel transport system substrate-binding protein n=1 Tax=Thermomonospora echinospora TaxID=1992 RepID=A0A1H6EAM9_9ACTN|nr:ABC transporter substrate-binding protein [Thermomonospora echinospora]SEG93966.1 peptide/nickel transport system substrate-binding protein [Thermomonospora echinospora]